MRYLTKVMHLWRFEHGKVGVKRYPVPMSARHVAKNSSERTTAIIILTVAFVVVAASLLGEIWLVRIGAVAGVVLASVAVFVAWQELRRERAEHRAEIKRQISLRQDQAERHHAESIAMIDRFNERAQNLKAMIARLRSQLASAHAELSTMRGNAAWLRGEVAERQARIDELETRIVALEEQLAAVEAQEDPSNVVELPRVIGADHVIELWDGDDDAPTMIKLSQLNLAHYDEPLAREA